MSVLWGRVDDCENVTLVPARSLQAGDSPRLAGENTAHTQLLAKMVAELPPILVHRHSLKVIDGVHRLRAALLNDQRMVEVRFFDGSEDEAFLVAVRENAAHGLPLPLSLADRRAAAQRIIRTHADWSDRLVAATVGLAPGTVARLRRREGAGPPAEVSERVGRDGRVRPLSAASGRRTVSEVLAIRPDVPLREVAKAAGVSVSTAHDVRRRVRRGENPIPAVLPRGRKMPPRSGLEGTPDRKKLIDALGKDPSLKFTESGRALLRWLLPQVAGSGGWRGLDESIPPHCAYLVARLAHACAQEWLDFANQIEQTLSDPPAPA